MLGGSELMANDAWSEWLVVDATGVAWVLVQPVADIPGFDLPQIIGLGVLAPAMIYAYRVNVRALDRSLNEAVKANERKDVEIDRLNAELERVRSLLRAETERRRRDTGPHPTTKNED